MISWLGGMAKTRGDDPAVSSPAKADHKLPIGIQDFPSPAYPPHTFSRLRTFSVSNPARVCWSSHFRNRSLPSSFLDAAIGV